MCVKFTLQERREQEEKKRENFFLLQILIFYTKKREKEKAKKKEKFWLYKRAKDLVFSFSITQFSYSSFILLICILKKEIILVVNERDRRR